MEVISQPLLPLGVDASEKNKWPESIGGRSVIPALEKLCLPEASLEYTVRPPSPGEKQKETKSSNLPTSDPLIHT